tara:strand:- start:2528 stop:2965 length:438 start_codon:yes stop_codon:yes gene_type:complete
MTKLTVALIPILALPACSTVNHSVGSIQFNAEAEPAPDNYRDVAKQAVSGRKTIDGSGLLVSHPATMAGETAFSPMRWYICVRGIAPKGEPPAIPALQRKIENWVAPPLVTAPYDLVVIFNEPYHWQVVEGFDTRLCRDAAFERL